MSWKLLKNYESEIIKELEKSALDGLFIGVSAGLDSVVLAHYIHFLINKYSLETKPTIIHLNHSLRKESDEEQVFVSRLADRLKFNLESKKIPFEITKQWSNNIENNARNFRYSFFNNITNGRGLILLGHHLDDDIEWNFIQRLKSSVVGKSQYIPKYSKNIYRPFLEVPRSTLEKISSGLNIAFCHDSSNDEVRFERNFIRNDVLPKIDERFSNFREHFLFQRYQNLSSVTPEQVERYTFESTLFLTFDLSCFPETLEDRFTAITYWIRNSLPKYSKNSGRGTISRQILKIIEASNNFKKGPILLSGNVFVFLDGEYLHLSKKMNFEIEQFTKVDTSDLDIDKLKISPLFLIKNNPRSKPASAFKIKNIPDGYFLVTLGYIKKNLKWYSNRKFDLFKVKIKGISK